MNDVKEYLTERSGELRIHLDLLEMLDLRSKDTSQTDEGFKVDVRQILILKSSILVHLYNIVEATFSKTLTALQVSVNAHHPSQYESGVFHHWIAGNVNIGSELNIGRLRDKVKEIGVSLVNTEQAWPELEIKKTDGNWDEKRIFNLSEKLNVEIKIKPKFKTQLNSHYLNNLTRLQYIRQRRNQLAHGLLTFEEGADGKTHADLVELSDVAIEFMTIVVDAYSKFMDDKKFIKAA